MQKQKTMKVIDLIEILLKENPSLPVEVQLGTSLTFRLVGSDLNMKEHVDAVKRADEQLQSGLLAASLDLNPDIRGMVMDLHNSLKPLLAELSKEATEDHENDY